MRSSLLFFAATLVASPLLGQDQKRFADLDRTLSTIRIPLEMSRLAIGSSLGAVRVQLDGLGSRIGHQVAPALVEAQRALAEIDASLGGGRRTGLDHPRAPEPWSPQDPADSLYRAARAALNRGNYVQAATLFTRIHDDHPKSSYTPDSYYWQAFAQYRSGTQAALNAGLEALKTQTRRYPSASTHGDAESLATRIRGELARTGNTKMREEITVQAESVGEARVKNGEEKVRKDERRGRDRSERCRDDDDDDDKTAALNALLQMDGDRALPILKKVLARRDPASTCLRRRAVFLVSQHESPETESILLNAVRVDPDPEVRSQAVFWLSQVDSEHAVVALDSILKSSGDEEIRDKALFALSQHDSPRAHQALRDFALKTGTPADLREKAIFWIGQSDREDNAPFLRNLYKTVKDETLQEKIIFSLSQMHSKENQRFLVQVASDNAETIELRKKALFWLGQSDYPLPELFGMYDRMTDREMREQLIFVYSQRSDRAAIDKLIQIVRTEKDRELRKKALFWLSQSGDARAAEVLGEILDK